MLYGNVGSGKFDYQSERHYAKTHELHLPSIVSLITSQNDTTPKRSLRF